MVNNVLLNYSIKKLYLKDNFIFFKKYSKHLLTLAFILFTIYIFMNFGYLLSFAFSFLFFSLQGLNSLYLKNFSFNSNMINSDDVTGGFYRLLCTDNNVVLPYGSWLRFLITSLDVLHSWAVPSLGIKLDACPGRLNQTSVFIKREGFFYGQCSEICGTNHAFMPITVEVVDMESFYFWCKNPISTFFMEVPEATLENENSVATISA